MLRKSLSILGGIAVISGLGAVFSTPSYASPGPFSCDTNNLTTVVGEGRSVIMRWRTNQFSEAGYSPLQRCLEVSERFNSFYSSGQLDFITAGYVNGQPVVCATTSGGSCNRSNVLFTLNRRNKQNVAAILQTLFDNRAGASGAVINESSERVYIDVKKLIGEEAANTQTNSERQPKSGSQPASQPASGSW
ncbi:COP23 domain-containing protein [Nostoc sphaeroides CHAB 2801]|uniref:COP23 domain-containing protein n=1 Tax=Nostoc sphaeroides TaxID=446679 RepID=UPI000E52D61C|nr:COP23 domain-containing protein [Nostoc sphaeroides]MCC5627043.1 COP23 domain-containing protein [Nostoc sphaeroides CHAB 2801]